MLLYDLNTKAPGRIRFLSDKHTLKFGTPKLKILFNIYKGFIGCPKKVRKTGKETLIDSSKHLVLKTAHPSPYSVTYGFFGCRHFSKTNQYLEEHGLKPIDWQL